MKLGQASITNFGPFADLTFDFSDLGIAMLTGDTGSGKSSLIDIPSWICFGVESKDSPVDEVRKWGTDITVGVQELREPAITITRIRGQPKQNDLFWTEAGSPEDKKRGKDATETQRLLNEKLGCDGELYLLAAYFTQFSDAGDFFTAKAKDRRETLERLADLSLPVCIAERASEKRKTVKKSLEALNIAAATRRGQLEAQEQVVAKAVALRHEWARMHGHRISVTERQSTEWAEVTAKRIEALQRQANAFAVDIDNKRVKLHSEIAEVKSKITSEAFLTKKYGDALICPTCLQSARPALDRDKQANAQHSLEIKVLKSRIKGLDEQSNTAQAELEYLKKVTENPHVKKLEGLKAETNPHVVDVAVSEDLKAQIKADKQEEKRLTIEIGQLSALYDLSFVARGELLRQVMLRLERQTNQYLEEYFDGELRVRFELAGSDKLEVKISKNGNETSFARLSGGQRCMLKLAFGVPRMAAAADRAGQHFELLAFDESLNGLSPGAKLKAYKMFEALTAQHSSVLLIDHDSTLNAMCSREIRVKLVGDCTVVEGIT